jgi:ATP-dependent DNA helicase DinG
MSILSEIVDTYFKKDGILKNNIKDFEYRESQHEIALKFSKFFNNGGIYIIEAGTGIGKTFAYLIPAILSQKKVVIATKSKNLQEQLFFKDIHSIEALIPFDFKSVFIKGRNNYVCLNKLSKLSVNNVFFKNEIIEKINKWVKSSMYGDLSEIEEEMENLYQLNIGSTSDSCMGTKCSFYKDCFIYKLKLEAEKSDIIIVNYHLLFADFKIKNEGFGKVLPEFQYLVCDEAHSIEDIATDYFGDAISKYKFVNFISELEKAEIKNIDRFKNSVEEFFLMFAKLPNDIRIDLTKVINNKIIQKADNLLNEILLLKDILLKKDEYPNLVNFTVNLANVIQDIFFTEDYHNVKWVEKTPRNISIKYSPVDASVYLKEFFYSLKGAAFTSATLAINNSFDFFKTRVGIEEADEESIYQSIFDYKKQSALFIPKSIPFPDDKEFSNKMGEILIELLKITKGNAFVLFTNLKNMHRVYNIVKERVKYKIFLQGTESNYHILEKFKKNKNSVLFGSFSFWEGIDIQGENLSLVVIEKIPFAVPSDPLKKARIEKIKDEGGNPFFSYQIPEAVMTLKQGIGRLIRSNKDKGIIAIFDKRILKKSYGRRFIENIPQMNLFQSIEDIILPLNK